MKFLSYFIALIAAAVLVIAAFGYASDANARRADARASLVRAQSQARLDATAAFLPYVVIAVSVVMSSGMVILGCAIYWSAEQKRRETSRLIMTETRTVERLVVVVLPAGDGRRAKWDNLLIERGSNDY